MTTFQYTLTLDDSEMIALTCAIDFYMAECANQQESGVKAPFGAHLDSLKKIRAKRHKHVQQTSGSGSAKQHGWEERPGGFGDWVQYDKSGNLL